MESYSNTGLIHVRMKNFAKWIAPEKEARDASRTFLMRSSILLFLV
jgi:hypothetical protein